MKKHVLIATGLAVLASPAFATKTRMAALGQDSGYGSHYIKDTRSIFRNAAHVNSMKNYVVTEWGAATGANSAATAPAAEGGFFREAGAFAYGVYMGSDLESQNSTRNATVAGGYAGSAIVQGNASFVNRDNELDLFFGGDMGVEWGAHLSYSKNKNEQTTFKNAEQSSFGLGLGAIVGDIEGYANFMLKDESEHKFGSAANDFKWEADTGMVLGAKYAWSNCSFFAAYEKRGSEYSAGTGVAKNATEQTVLTFGAGHIKEVSATSRMIWDVSFNSSKGEDKDGTTATNNAELKSTTLPVTVGFETDATSWLTLRGSAAQAVLINNVENKTSSTATTKRNNQNNTSVNAGATLNFGKLKVDGSIGTNGVNGNHTNAKNGVLDMDRLLTQVAVHYWF